MVSAAAACCSPCASRSDDAITALVRVVGAMRYPTGVEHVAPHADSLGDPAGLRGLRVELGHGGEVIGQIIAAKRMGHALIAKIEITDPRHRADAERGQWSLEYDVARLDADGVQRGVTFRALASVNRGRCDNGSGMCRTLSRPSHKDSKMPRRFDIDAHTGPVEPTADDPAPSNREGERSVQRLRGKVTAVEGQRLTIVVADGGVDVSPGALVTIEVARDPEARADEARDVAARRRMIERGQRPQPRPPVRPTMRAYR